MIRALYCMALDPKWTATMDDGISNAAWDEYDQTIKKEVDGYNLRFGSKAGYKQVDWKLCKAILWVESGGPSSTAWKMRVMQIGNPGDQAYRVLKGGKEGTSIIMAIQLAADIKTKKIDDPVLNIQAAIAYILTRMTVFENQSVEDSKDKKEYSYVVRPGDSLAVIAARVGTTIEVLQTMNPKAGKMIHPKDTLKYKKAKIELVISGWRNFTTANLAKRYNGGGDPAYGAKLDYVLDLFKKLKR